LRAKVAENLFQKIEKIEAKENTGSYGQWRRNFCRKYRELLIQARDNSYNSLVKTLSSKGKTISCRKECAYCCFHYVAAPLAHGIVIVDYLYNRKKLLKQFIYNYKKWHHNGYDISNINDHKRNQAFSLSQPIDDIIEVTRPLSMRYLEMEIPCPFLVNRDCSIYAVRPLPCSGQYSVSPPDWCAISTEKKAEIHQLVPDDEDLIKFLQLVNPQLMLYEITLPIMIYKLLTAGVSSFEIFTQPII
jgi:Fe-S-cluster containining protein